MQVSLIAQGKDDFVTRAPDGPAAKAKTTKRATPDDFELCRRLDWRILLAAPRLRRVGYVGIDSGALVEALKRFSESLTVFATSDESFAASQSRKQFDLLVLRMPAVRDVEMMRHLLKPDGGVYIELFKPGPEHGRSQKDSAPLNYKSYVSVLQRTGFTDINIYWHRPNFEQCLEIIPLTDRVALRHVFSRQSHGFKSRAKFFVGRLAMRFGLLTRHITSVSLIARKSATGQESR